MSRVDTETRVALVVKYSGQPDIWIDVDEVVDLTLIEMGLSQMVGSAAVDRLWRRGAERMQLVCPADTPGPVPIGVLLAPGELHSLVLSDVEPPLRGG